MSYIQLSYDLVGNEKQLEFNLPKHYEESQYIKILTYVCHNGPEYSNSVLNHQKWLLAIGDCGHE